MLLDRWNTAVAKRIVSVGLEIGYDTDVSSGESRYSQNTGEEKCTRNSLFSHWRQLFCLDAPRLVNQLALVLAPVLPGQRCLALIPLQAQSLAGSQDMLAIRATFVANTRSSAPRRSFENSKGMRPAGRVPFCLPNT